MNLSKPSVSFAAVDSWIDDSYPMMEQALLELIRFPSVRGEAAPGAPFGEAAAQALAHTLELCEQHGLKTENLDGFIGIADLPGASDECVGVLAHLDVVSATPESWTRGGPFDPVVKEGRIYGRGAVDDKGPLVASLFAGIALRACGIPLGKTVRFLFGCDEETDFECIEHYNKHRQPPTCGFSPDGLFPAVIGEKGLAQYTFAAEWQPDEGSALQLLSCTAGQMSNIVPDRAQAVLRIVKDYAVPQPASDTVRVTREGDTLTVTATGMPAHASLPDLGKNVLDAFLPYLLSLDFGPAGAKAYLATIARLFADSSYGKTLGVDGKDDCSVLTTVPSVLRVGEREGTLECDMRFPVTHNGAQYRRAIAEIAEKNALRLTDFRAQEPLYVSEDSPLAQALLTAYRGYTGDMSPPHVMGGGTYAKHLPNFMAFGPGFAGDEECAHQADEYISVKGMLDCAKIFARAIYELAK